MKKKMFYEADPLIFGRAKELRNHLTDAEMRLWGYLRTKPGGHKFRRQHPLQHFIADFYCHSLKLVIEVDGSVHNDPEIKLSDAERQSAIESAGIQVIRFTNEEILHHYEGTISAIDQHINPNPLAP